MHGGARHRHQQQNLHRPRSSSTIQSNPTHRELSLRVPSPASANVRPLFSVQSEGESMRTRALASRVLPRAGSGPSSIAPLPVTRVRRQRQEDNSSDDESAGEEVIVRIDSPSTLTFHQASDGNNR